nr:TadG family pilus assembly protein [Methylobacterium sp.]
MLFALSSVTLLGFAGIAVDIGLAFNEKNDLLTSAEASALATAKYIGGADRALALATAQTYAALNRPTVDNLVTDADLQFGKWENGVFTVGENPNAVRVTASRTRSKGNSLKTTFANFFGVESWDLSARAIAVSSSPICILILHPDHHDAFDVDPGARIDAPTCGVQVNSRHREALELGRSSYVSVKNIRVVGGFDKHSTATVTPTPVTGVEPVSDPYASLSPPMNNLCGGAKDVTGTVTLSPNLAFCNGLRIKGGTVTFSPGVYVVKGEFTLENGASIVGQDVLIYMEGRGSDLFFHSRTSFNLKAPTTGPYAGIVLWSDRENTKDHDIYSKFGASAEGTIYAPSSQVEFENDVVWEANCIRIVVARLELDNGSRYQASDPSTNCRNNINKGNARLVR